MSKKTNKLRARVKQLEQRLKIADGAWEMTKQAARMADEKAVRLEAEKAKGWRADGSIVLSLRKDMNGGRYGQMLQLALTIMPDEIMYGFDRACGGMFRDVEGYMMQIGYETGRKVGNALLEWVEKQRMGGCR